MVLQIGFTLSKRKLMMLQQWIVQLTMRKLLLLLLLMSI
jgi:hypothetical protein